MTSHEPRRRARPATTSSRSTRATSIEIRTCGDELVKNLDVYLYDLSGKVIAQDTTEDREPMFGFKPEATGTYYIVVHARELTDASKEAGVAMAVTYK